MYKYVMYIVFGLFATTVSAQVSQEELEARKAKLQKEIKENEKLFLTVKKKEKSAEKVVEIQEMKIKLKEKLIHTTEKQIKLVNNDLYITQLEINKLKTELEILKQDYSKMIVKSYKSRSEESRAMFLLSSENFLQAYKRAQYMKQYTSFRKAQGEEIKVKSDKLNEAVEQLKVKRQSKQKLLNENEKEKESLEDAKDEQQKLVNSLKKNKAKIAQNIKKQHQEAKAIDRQIERMIREAIAEANRKAAAEKARLKAAADAKAKAVAEAKRLAALEAKKAGKPVSVNIPAEKESAPSVRETASAPVSSTKIDLTPEAKIVSDNFRANRGRLPFPVERGTITLGYGSQTHPVYKTLTVHNSGVEITTEQGASARAVFDGVVTSVIQISPVNKAVIIQHGDYFTVYQNLSSVNVSKGDKVSRKQSVGRIRTNGETGKTVLKFLIMQNTTYTNPQPWLSRE